MNIPQKKLNRFILFLVIIITGFSFFFISKLDFDYDFEAFFPNEDEELNVYQKYRETFEYDNEFVLLGIERKKGIFDKSFLKQIDSLTNQLKKIKDVKLVTSPTNLKQLTIGGLGPIEIPLLHFNDTSLYKDDSINIFRSPDLIGSFFPKNGKSLCIFIKTEDRLSKEKSDSLASRIERTFSAYHFEEVHFVGRIVAQDVYLKKLKGEFFIFISVSFFVIILFLFGIFEFVFLFYIIS